MGRFRFLTAGESHGKGLVAIAEGMVADLSVEEHYINKELKRRQQGYGRGRRMKIEDDKVEIIAGVRHGLTTGSPIALFITNRDWENSSQHILSYSMHFPVGEKTILRKVSYLFKILVHLYMIFYSCP